jgi:hypothetical protein
VTRSSISGIAAVATAGILVLVGRWEEDRAVAEQVSNLRAMRMLAGQLGGPRLTSSRDETTLDCLLYSVGENPVAVQLCYDSAGRLVEAVDRRNREPVYWSIVHSPEEASVTVDSARIARILRKHGWPG